MKTTIYIDCDSIQELQNHLRELIRQTKKVAKKEGLGGDDEFTRKHAKQLSDNNCYGTHYASIS